MLKSKKNLLKIVAIFTIILITIFGLTKKQVKQVERNDGLTDEDIESN